MRLARLFAKTTFDPLWHFLYDIVYMTDAESGPFRQGLAYSLAWEVCRTTEFRRVFLLAINVFLKRNPLVPFEERQSGDLTPQHFSDLANAQTLVGIAQEVITSKHLEASLLELSKSEQFPERVYA